MDLEKINQRLGPNSAHDLSLLGPAAYGTWQAPRPSQPEWGRLGPWSITTRAACGTRSAGQRGDRGHRCHGDAARGGAAVLAGGKRRGRERIAAGGPHQTWGVGAELMQTRPQRVEDAGSVWTENSGASWSSRRRLTTVTPHEW
jgi:hypothetical protein